MKTKWIGMVLGATVLFALSSHGDTLAEGFQNPPPSVRPQVWWHWMNGNVTREGITADLEAMARAGIGGAFIFDVTDGIPEGRVPFASNEWMELLRHADAEARRLGVAIGLSNCSGWSSSGGPWVKPEDSMKSLVWTETHVAGGTHFEGRLPAPPNPHGFYRDLAVLAIPRPAAEAIDLKDYGITAKATFASKPGDKRMDAMREGRDIPGGCNLRRPVKGGKENIATFTFARPFPLAGLRCSLESPIRHETIFAILEVSEDGKNFRSAGRQRIHLSIFGDKDNKDVFLPCPLPNARAVRVTFEFPKKDVWHKLWNLRPTAAGGIPDFKAKTFQLRSDLADIPYVTRPDQIVPRNGIIDLTHTMNADGSLKWDAPSGDWILLRFGYAANGARPRPATKAGDGLECDKLSVGAVERFFDGYVGRALRLFGPRKPFPESGFNNVLVDSYEVGCQNWTDGFEQIFQKKKGYDIIPYLPIFAGRIVGGQDETERVLEDFRRVVSDLFVECYGATFARLCHERGLYFSLEGYGNAPCDDLKYARQGDFTMGEFWAGSAKEPLKLGNCRFGASVAHVWGGGRIVSSESFTSGAETRWLKDPFALKAQGDRVWCAGINQIVYHSYPHQPWLNPSVYPGMTMGGHGTQYGRTLTWWEQSGAWHRYQARSQFLLRQGVISGDVLIYNGDAAPNSGYAIDRWHWYADISPAPFAYQWDVCGADAVHEMRVDHGMIVTPSGARYALLFLPASIQQLSGEALADLERLAAAGAKIAAAGEAPRLLGKGYCAETDVQNGKRFEALWEKITRTNCEKALAAAGVKPNFLCLTPGYEQKVSWIHRIADDGSDLYFVAVPNATNVNIEASFRIAGRAAELWNAETGERTLCSASREADGRTIVPLSFTPSGSMFVLFRPSPTPGVTPARQWRETVARTVDGAWEVAFVNGRGAPERTTFDQLVSWTERPEKDVRYYSGTAIYTKTIEVPKADRVVLDLGEVKNLVDVTVNGITYPTLWKPPFRVDVTDAVKGRNKAELRLKVTNLWPNRLIGDEELPPHAPYLETGRIEAIPEWVWQGKPSHTGRKAFATWQHWHKGEKLLPSGLLGPVRIVGEAAL
ncbi:MAG: hypothetical protein IKR48_05200 [Kiritimatiellae bacterium]|nr:hypothetical protein [Kiritimatiellia bacterium]